MKKYLLLIALLTSILSYGQRISKKDIKVDFNYEYQQLYTDEYFIDSNSYLIDPEVKKNRVIDSTSMYSPFNHAGSYIRFGLNANYKNKVDIELNSYFEHRGWSNGLDQIFNVIVFPRYKIKYEDTIEIADKNIYFYFKNGILDGSVVNKNDIKLYNIEFYGFKSILAYKNNYLNLVYSADASQNVGLFVDEYYRLELHRKYTEKDYIINYGLTSSFMTYDRSGFDRYNNYGMILSASIANNFIFLFTLDSREGNGKLNNKNNIALKTEIEYNKNNFKIKIKHRYFGKNYNLGHYERSYYDKKYRYRLINNPRISYYYNYPLKNYFRNVSQWAFYTEYQESLNINSLELLSSYSLNLYKNFNLDIELEALSVFRNSTDYKNYFIYYFYSANLYYQAYDNLKIGLYSTNKQMNLDIQYQGFYQAKYPMFGFNISYQGSFNK